MILVIVEHDDNKVEDITFEILSKATELSKQAGLKTCAVLLADKADKLIDDLKSWANEIFVAENERFKVFNSEIYEQVLSGLIKERKPKITMMGYLFRGMDLAPSLSVSLGMPLVMNVVDMRWEDSDLVTEREVYGGKARAVTRFSREAPYMVVVQQASFKAENPGLEASITKIEPSIDDSKVSKRHIKYVEQEAGEVDITSANIIVSAGRGIGGEKNLSIINDLAEQMGGVCSRFQTTYRLWLACS
jgi:electron transfer flavoprotein alpha subunit